MAASVSASIQNELNIETGKAATPSWPEGVTRELYRTDLNVRSRAAFPGFYAVSSPYLDETGVLCQRGAHAATAAAVRLL